VERKILVIGVGNMGYALVNGLKDVANLTVSVFDTHPERLAKAGSLGTVTVVDSLASVIAKQDVVVFCVKPQDLLSVAKTIAGKIRSDSLVMSILAGMTMNDLSEALAFKGAVVRAMPNIAATVHAAATAMCANSHAQASDKALAEHIFSQIGTAHWCLESHLDAVTGLSGSGPAYVYMVIEALTEGGVKMGIPRVLAHSLASQTVLGAALLVKESGLHPAVLRDQVTTPGGTTIAAIHDLENRGLRATLMSAVEVATQRASFLRKS
jgi:pyrroline-5-carboxylate reductase